MVMKGFLNKILKLILLKDQVTTKIGTPEDGKEEKYANRQTNTNHAHEHK